VHQGGSQANSLPRSSAIHYRNEPIRLPGFRSSTEKICDRTIFVDSPLEQCGRLGSIAAAEVISHFGARLQRDLSRELAALGPG
jgi:sugar/nucleoside kinase (ribokinase family)